jgi:hypothetical protein
MRLTPFAALLAVVALTPLPAFADASLATYDAARDALLAVWAELPLTVRNVTLTREIATGYGAYQPRDGHSYSIGEQIHVYVEVLGYGWRDNADGTLSSLLDADLNLLDASGNKLATQPKFLDSEQVSRQKLLETYLTLNASLTSFEPGDYQLQFVLHDLAGHKDTTFAVPVTLVGDASSAAPQ